MNKIDKIDKKLKKRRNIANSCRDLFVEHSFNNISVSEIARTAKIGKGTVYEYFNNKEDIVCELMDSMQNDYDYMFSVQIYNIKDDKDKILTLFSIFTSKDETIIKQKEIYKQFLFACLSKPTDRLIDYNVSLREKYASLIASIVPEINAYKMYDCVIGFFIASESLKKYDLESKIISCINKDMG